jgi:signal transduction histidine kinase
VEDHGVGINKTTCAHLRSLLHNQAGVGGSGLGLHIVHNIVVEILGGSDVVASWAAPDSRSRCHFSTCALSLILYFTKPQSKKPPTA